MKSATILGLPTGDANQPVMLVVPHNAVVRDIVVPSRHCCGIQRQLQPDFTVAEGLSGDLAFVGFFLFRNEREKIQ